MADTNPRRSGTGPGPAQFIVTGFVFGSTLAIPIGLGYLLDRFLGTMPLFLLLGLGFGFTGGLYYVYTELRKLGGG